MISIVGVIRVRSLRPAGCKICSFAKFSPVSQSDAVSHASDAFL